MHRQSSRPASHSSCAHHAQPLAAQFPRRHQHRWSARGRSSACRQPCSAARPPARGPQLLCRCAATAASPPQRAPVAEARLDAQVRPVPSLDGTAIGDLSGAASMIERMPSAARAALWGAGDGCHWLCVCFAQLVGTLLCQVAAVLGSQWGDEGKGKLVDILAQQYDVVARAQVCKASLTSAGRVPLLHSIKTTSQTLSDAARAQQSCLQRALLCQSPVELTDYQWLTCGIGDGCNRAARMRGTRSMTLRATNTSCTSYRRVF